LSPASNRAEVAVSGYLDEGGLAPPFLELNARCIFMSLIAFSNTSMSSDVILGVNSYGTLPSFQSVIPNVSASLKLGM
jgi:hypothetical protein